MPKIYGSPSPPHLHPIGAAMGSSLLALGLYTVAFEATIRLIKTAVAEHVDRVNIGRGLETFDVLPKLDSAHKAINFCCPILIQEGAMEETAPTFLHNVRKYRNQIVHDSISSAFVSPSLTQVFDEVDRMIQVADRVEVWQKARWPAPPPRLSRMAFSFAGLVEMCREAAESLSSDTWGPDSIT